ncbi:MAG: hypothetical protein CVU52_08735 [Deltaproteobacteria bacterium HGW-Deltaproteobacteria-10]|nr:MAG: hypothetical protein CVU52_08735 [Deltaproteobacteria bacterium HGW-Deltaproteobacteria-10]
MRSDKYKPETLDAAIEGHTASIEFFKDQPDKKSDMLFMEISQKYLQRFQKAAKEGEFLIASGGMLPSEILVAMGIVPYLGLPMALRVGYFDANRHEMIDKSRAEGMPTGMCSAQNLWMGAISLGLLPMPDVVLATSHVCDDGALQGPLISSLLNVPTYRIDRPFYYSDDALRYYVSELKAFIKFLEEKTKRKMDWDRLAEVVECSRQANVLRAEIEELRKMVPSPMKNRDIFKLQIAEFFWCGHPESVEMCRVIRDELMDRVNKVRDDMTDEKLRIILMYFPPTYAIPMMKWWEKEWGAVSVAEPLFTIYPSNDYTLDPKNPLETLAKKEFLDGFANSQFRPGPQVAADCVRLAKEYKVDGGVWYAPHHCRGQNSMIKMVTDALKNIGVQTAVIDSDYVDSRYASEKILKEKTALFFEILKENKR